MLAVSDDCSKREDRKAEILGYASDAAPAPQVIDGLSFLHR